MSRSYEGQGHNTACLWKGHWPKQQCMSVWSKLGD